MTCGFAIAVVVLTQAAEDSRMDDGKSVGFRDVHLGEILRRASQQRMST